MRKIFLISILWILPINAFAAGWNSCLTYKLSCENDVIEIGYGEHECSYIGSLFYTPDDAPLVAITPKDLLQKGEYLPSNLTYDGPNSHNCTLGDHKVKVEMSHIEVPTDSSFQYFCPGSSDDYIMVANLWLDGKKIVDDLYFNGTCDKEKNIPGNLLLGFEIKALEHNKSSVLFDAFLSEDGERKHRTFFLNVGSSPNSSTPPKEGAKAKNTTPKTLTTPLKNIHIHDHDMQYEFWDPLEERARIMKEYEEQYPHDEEYYIKLEQQHFEKLRKQRQQQNNP